MSLFFCPGRDAFPGTILAGVFLLSAMPGIARSQETPDPGDLKKMTLEELMSMEVTSVSRHPEKLTTVASAIQVISQDDIRRSGATSLPEALRLAPNLQVAQVNASQWAISARGFDNVLANKLLVMIDGRTVYTPLYAGVFWDVQDTLLEDVDRIEVISGPGGALWGANAVNGVINITTRSAAQTQGLFVEAAAGNELRGLGGMRYGGEFSPDLHYRVYAGGFERDDTQLLSGANAKDGWHMGQGGFRMDWTPGGERLTLQGDVYQGKPDPDGGAPVTVHGGNVLGRWEHTLGENSDFQLQWYYDRTLRDFGNGFAEDLRTYDIDWQHRFQLGHAQTITWGLGVRWMDDQEQNLPLFAFLPAHDLLHLYSGFVQDEIILVPDRLRFTLGAKFERNDFTGFETQPSARLAWTPTADQVLWAAASRAVRTPSRIDRDFSLSIVPGLAAIAGGDFQSEQLRAYEAGWRWQTQAGLSLSVSTFYNDYDDIRSAEPGPPPFGLPITFGNDVRGNTYGAELALTQQLTQAWRIRGGYTFLKKKLEVKTGTVDLNGATAESDDPANQFLIQSMLDLPGRIELDTVLRYVDQLPQPRVDSYWGLDVRVAWHPSEHLEVSLVGQNLFDTHHQEFVPTSPAPRAIERSVYAKIAWRH